MKRIFITMRHLLILLFLIATCSSNTMATNICEPYFHQVPAEQGDYISKLLGRYYLNEHKCNYEQFYALNDLNAQSQLIAGKEYFIPALIYDYDGRSIRSTLNIDNWAQAIRVKKYNETIRKEGHRQYTIAASKILWVPYHELHCFNSRIYNPSPEEQAAAEIVINDKPKTNTKKSKSTNSIYPGNVLPRTSPKDRTFVPNTTTNNIETPIPGARQYAIFGKDHAHVPLIDNSLKGKIFYIVSGHGGPDSGAVGKRAGNQLCEDEYAYDVALRLCRNLIAHGATAYMITRDPDDGIRSGKYLKHDRDEYCWGNYKLPRSQKTRLFQRSDAVNELYFKHKNQGIDEQIMVSIHIDSRSQRERTDIFFYYYPNSQQGKSLAKTLQQTIKSKYKKHNPSKRYHGSVTGRDLHMLREPYTTSAYIELGNIRNPHDQQRFVIESNRQALADWLYDGLKNYATL